MMGRHGRGPAEAAIAVIACLLLAAHEAGAADPALRAQSDLRIERIDDELSTTPDVATYTARQVPGGSLQIDGRLDDWPQVGRIVVDSPALAVGDWEGPDDLRAEAMVVWDERFLYLAFDVTDDALHPAPPDLWSGDAVQLAIDALNDDTAERFGADDYDLTIGRTEDGPRLVRNRVARGWQAEDGETTQLSIAVKADSSGYVYELALSWDDLRPLAPVARQVCGFGFVVPDNDGRGFEGGLQWTPGIWYGKNPALYANLVLANDPGSDRHVFLSPGATTAADGDTIDFHIGVSGGAAVPLEVSAEVAAGSTAAWTAAERLEHNGGVARYRVRWLVGTAPVGRYRFTVTAGSSQSTWTVDKQSMAALQAATDQVRQQALEAGLDEGARLAVEVQLRKLAQGVQADMSLLLDDAYVALGEIASQADAEGQAGTGEVRRGFVSEVDGSLRSYRLFVPESYDDAPHPLIVWLHGLGGSEDTPAPDSLRIGARERGILVVLPDGRAGNYGRARLDVLRVIEDVQARYRIDPDRIYLAGMSAGGMGTWLIGMTHHDRFAAIAPFAGVVQGSELADNLLHLAPYIVHGDADAVVDVSNAHYMVDELTSRGFEHRYAELPGVGHGGALYDEWPRVLDWFEQHRRPSRPARVTHMTRDAASAGAHWVRVEERLGQAPARVDAQAREGGRVEITALGVARLRLRLDRSPVEGQDLRIVGDHGELPVGALPQGSDLMLSRNSDTEPWQAATVPALRVFSSEPRLLVVHGYSTSRIWWRRLQQKLDRYFERRLVEVAPAIMGGTPIARWMNAATGERREPWIEVLQPVLASRGSRPVTVLAQQSLQWVYGDRREGIRGADDEERIQQGATALGRYAELLLEDGAEEVILGMHIYKHPMEPEIGNERLALAALMARPPQGVFAGPDVWAPTKAQYPRAFADDGLHPNELGAHIMAQAWFEALLAREGIEVPSWSRDELETELRE